MAHAFAGQPTEVLILGCTHIGAETPDLALASTLRRLKAWNPDLVGIEILPGELVELFASQGGWLHNLKYGGFPLARRLGPVARTLLGISRSEAMSKVREEIDSTRKVLLYLAANEPWNALLHWSPELELPTELAEAMHELSTSPSETVRLGVATARALGHESLCLFDDFPVQEMGAARWEDFIQAAEAPEYQAWAAEHPFIQSVTIAQRRSEESGDYWDLLRCLGTAQSVGDHLDLENEANLRLGLPGRAKQADWDARNLLMAGRVRMALMSHVGGRVLIIVGHGHKGPMEAALRALGPDVRLAELDELEAL